MRELYRWERGVGFAAELSRTKVGAWLSRRETLWRSLEGRDFQSLPLGGDRVDPFAVATINAELIPAGLVYSAGFGRRGRAQFHLGELEREERRGDVRILVAGREYARDLGSAPAALLEATVYVRQESLRRWLWGKFEAWRARKPEGALAATLAAYGFAADPQAALERTAEAETETLILHELGEFAAGRELGPEWEATLSGLADPRAEFALRALRDNLADCLVTLPALLERGAAPSLHFWFATFEGLRSELFPRLAGAYRAWCRGDSGPLRDAIAAGREHWRRACAQVLALDRDRAAAFERAIARLAASPAARL